MKKENNKNEKRKNQLNDYVRYSSLAIQMLAIILLGTWGGIKLDSLLDLSLPIFTIFLSLASVALAIYFAIKDFINKK